MATSALVPQNSFSTTLATAISGTDTTIFLNALPTASEGYLTFDEGLSTQEIMYYTSKGSNFVTLPSVGAGRGVGGTSAVGHSVGAVVKMKITAEYWKALQDGSALSTSALTPTKMANPYKFSVYRNGAWSAPNGFSKVQFDSKDYDTGSNFDVTTNFRFTAPISGFYAFTAGVGYSAQGGKSYLTSLWKNGSETSGKRGNQTYISAGPTGVLTTVTADFQLAAGDYIETYFFNGGTQVGGDGSTGTSLTYFQGRLASLT